MIDLSTIVTVFKQPRLFSNCVFSVKSFGNPACVHSNS